MDYQYLTKERQGHISIVTFNRPESANALNRGFMEEIEHVSKSFLYDEETRVVVFAAAGKHFCAGWDFKEPPPKEQPSLLLKRRETGLGGRMLRSIFEINQVTIAAV